MTSLSMHTRKPQPIQGRTCSTFLSFNLSAIAERRKIQSLACMYARTSPTTRQCPISINK